MAKQRIVHGAIIDTLTPDEFVKLQARPEQRTRIREPAQVQLDGSGSGVVAVYKIPAGFQFEVRRVTLDIGGAVDPSTGNVPLNVAGKYVKYRRSGSLIEYGVPVSPNAVPQVPGVQTWGEQQGPYLRNGEVFEVEAKGLTANQLLTVIIEGILDRPAEPPKD